MVFCFSLMYASLYCTGLNNNEIFMHIRYSLITVIILRTVSCSCQFQYPGNEEDRELQKPKI